MKLLKGVGANYFSSGAGHERDSDDRIERFVQESGTTVGKASLGAAGVKTVDFVVVDVIDDGLFGDGESRIGIGPTGTHGD
jgi:hypothetical protein